MKTRRKLNYIIFLMSIALIGLIGLQIYWVNISLKVKKERFNQDVHAALDNIVKKLEKREAAYVVKNKFFTRPSNSNFVITEQRRGNFKKRKKSVSATFQYNQLKKDSNLAHDPTLLIDFSRQYTKINPKDISTINVRKNDQGKSTVYISTETNVKGNRLEFSPVQDSGKLVNIKSKMISLVLDELIDRPKTLQERITRELLDSLLNIELIAKGIDIPYEFNVIDVKGTKPHYIFQESKTSNVDSYQKQLASAKYATLLFPNDIRPKNNQLLVNFPNEQTFMLKKMWMVLASAFIFIGLIIFCFTFAVNTILKQKKMSDMTKDFINNMTHEFKTPIATVSLACQAMQDPDIQQLPNQMNRYLGMVKEENDRLGQQVEKVLQIARLDREDFKLNITEVDVHQSIKKAIRNIQIQVEKRGGVLNAELNAAQASIHADEMHLTNIIINLLDNANKYSPETPEITIQTQNSERGIKVMISDKGQGISKEMINKVFDKFYRAPTGNVHDVKGFGLGLSYVKTMVDAHHGEIQVKSEPSKGSTFTLFFPYMAQSA